MTGRVASSVARCVFMMVLTGRLSKSRVSQLTDFCPLRLYVVLLVVIGAKIGRKGDAQGFGQALDVQLRHEVRPMHLDCRSEEHTSELQSLMRISNAVFCFKKKRVKQN